MKTLWSLIHLLRTYPAVGKITTWGISWNPCILLRTHNVQKFHILGTSNIFCTKTVLNKFSSYSLKPRCIIGFLHLPAHRHSLNPPSVAAPAPSWVHFCAAYNHLDEIQNFRSDCCLWFSRGLGKTIRPAVVQLHTSICWYWGPVWDWLHHQLWTGRFHLVGS